MINLVNCSDVTLNLEGGMVMRPLKEEDVCQAYVDGLNDDEVGKYLAIGQGEPHTWDSVSEFVRQNMEAPDFILFGLFVDDQLVGTSRISVINEERSTIGLVIFDRSQWGKGWGSKVIYSVTDFALTEVDADYVDAGINAVNISSQKAFQKAGFVHLVEQDHFTGEYNSQMWRKVKA